MSPESSSAPSPEQAAARGDRLAQVPVSLFAAVMGITGLGLAWREAGRLLGWPGAIGEAILILGALAFVAVALAYGAKIAARASLAAEFAQPRTMVFFPTIGISLLLLAQAVLPHSLAVAEPLWLLGVASTLTLSALILGRWLGAPHDLGLVSPAWFIGGLGNVIAVPAGVKLGYVGLSWFGFAVGVMFWVTLFPLILHRLIFIGPLPLKLRPVLFILIAPPALCASAWHAFNGGALDAPMHVFTGMALFLALAMIALAPQFRALPFAVSWWAFTFPLDALSIALLQYQGLIGGAVAPWIAQVALALATAIVAHVAWRTLTALARGTLFAPD